MKCDFSPWHSSSPLNKASLWSFIFYSYTTVCIRNTTVEWKSQECSITMVHSEVIEVGFKVYKWSTVSISYLMLHTILRLLCAFSCMCRSCAKLYKSLMHRAESRYSPLFGIQVSKFLGFCLSIRLNIEYWTQLNAVQIQMNISCLGDQPYMVSMPPALSVGASISNTYYWLDGQPYTWLDAVTPGVGACNIEDTSSLKRWLSWTASACC